MPVLTTVRNTGSHTAHNILRAFRLHMLTEDRKREPILWFGHTESQNLSLIDERMKTDPPLILTMRNPLHVWASWRRRRRPPDHTFKIMWRNLFALKAQYDDSFWLTMDTADRDERLIVIEERVGKKLNHDWSRKGVFQSAHDCDEGMTLDEAVKFFDTLPFGQFGYGYNC